MRSILSKISWWFWGVLCILVGLYPAIYFFIDRRFGLLAHKTSALLSDLLWNIGFYGHITLGGLALAIGWLQFNKTLRKRKLNLHRQIGKIYVISALISGVCGIYIGFFATGGIISQIGFISLGLFWLYTTISAFIAIKNNKVVLHQNYMTYSYAACFAAVTLRIWLPILIVFSKSHDFIAAYKIVAWLSWLPNIFVAYLLIRLQSNRRKRSPIQS